MKDLIRNVYSLLVDSEGPITPAGVCYRLRGETLPPVYSEAERSLDWLACNGFARKVREGDFGPEYVKY